MKLLNFKKLIFSKRLLFISTFIIFVFLLVVLNISFSIFSSRSESDMANIKVAGMNYSITVNGISNRIITATKNDTTKANIVLTSLNNRDSKYELTYKVCSDSSCTNFIEKPSELTVEYSSRTIDPITESITSSGTKQIRIAITNTGATTYYIKLDINAGFIYNTLALKNLITTEYNEEDVTIAAIIDGEISTTFPTTNDYIASVTCETNNGPSNASGSVTWNGTKWVVSITGVDSGRTICNVYFETPAWYTAPEGTLLHAIKQNSQLNPSPPTIPGREIAETNEGLLAAPDDYGISYYFRGAVENNYVEFANKCWRIVRVTGDGSIKLVLYNDNPNNVSETPCEVADPTAAYARWRTGTGSTPYTTAFNTSYNYNAYVGFMYGTPGSSSYAGEHANSTPSTILQALQSWYNANSLSTYASYLADSIWCNDKSVDTVYVYGTTNGFGTESTGYGARGRNYAGGNYATQANPTLVCPNDKNGGKLSKFTVNDTENGNGALSQIEGYPPGLGLLTADEVAFAGGIYNTQNQNYYLNKNASSHWWTSSPCTFDGSYALVWFVNSSGKLFMYSVHNSNALRPAVSLKSTVTATGEGTSTNSYKITGLGA